MAVTIVLFHAGIDWMWNVAVTGVTFFFLSSTFLLALHHPAESITARDYRRFAVSHAMRLYPLHWLGLALLVALALIYRPSYIDWSDTVLSALLVQSWFPSHATHYGLNPVAWYMCCLLFCYLIYPLMARAIKRLRLWHKILIITILSITLAVILLPLDIPGREAVFVNPLSHVLDMAVGFTILHLYHITAPRCRNIGDCKATLLEVGALALLAIAITVNVTTTWVKPWEDVLIWLIPQGSILLVMALLNGQEGALGKLLLSRPLQWLGSISFEVYVLQFVAFRFFGYVVAPFAGHYGWDIYRDLQWYALPLILPLAWLVNKWFTRPVNAYLKRHLSPSSI